MLLIADRRRPDQFDFRWLRRWDRLLAGLLAASLDRKLAAGWSPKSNRLLAIRAQTLVAPATRQTLATSLEKLLEAAHRPRQPGDPRIPLCRDRITAAESDLRDMVNRLLAPHPVPARGVAIVTSLLRDGTGPLYNCNSVLSLPSLVRRAVAAMDPSIGFDPPA